MEVLLRKEAMEERLGKYFTGKPCKNGHIAERRTCDGGCCECSKLKYTSGALSFHQEGFEELATEYRSLRHTLKKVEEKLRKKSPHDAPFESENNKKYMKLMSRLNEIEKELQQKYNVPHYQLQKFIASKEESEY